MERVLMRCGHAAQATDRDGHPVCVICYGLRAGAAQLGEPVHLRDRKARCVYCKKEAASDPGLPFFEYRPDDEADLFYCGCFGWE